MQVLKKKILMIIHKVICFYYDWMLFNDSRAYWVPKEECIRIFAKADNLYVQSQPKKNYTSRSQSKTSKFFS